jgi:hypothetical protein
MKKNKADGLLRLHPSAFILCRHPHHPLLIIPISPSKKLR